jgi:hypothetical protein
MGKSDTVDRLRAAVLAVLAIGMVSAPKAWAETAHRFVQVGEALPPIYFVDLATVRKSGDTLSFDTLEVNWLYKVKLGPTGMAQIGPDNFGVPELDGELHHRTVSCGWRTDQSAPQVLWLDASGSIKKTVNNSVDAYPLELMGTYDRLTEFVDRACAGSRLTGVREIGSLAEAMEDGKRRLPPPGPPSAPSRHGPPEPADWMGGVDLHDFAEVTVPDGTGNRLFIDRLTFKRQGANVTGLSLVLLNAEAQRTHRITGQSVAALRLMDYDCRAGAETIQAEAHWDRFGALASIRAETRGRLRAADSPVTTAEIAAACGPAISSQASFRSVDDAWAYVRSQWPPEVDRFKTECMWNAFAPDERQAFLSTWSASGIKPAVEVIKRQPLSQMRAQCGVAPEDAGAANDRFANYAIEQAAFAVLEQTRGLPSAKIVSVWRALPWRDRQRFAKALDARNAEETRFQNETADKVAKALGLSTPDDLAQLHYIILGEAYLKAN